MKLPALVAMLLLVSAARAGAGDCVVLLHGLARSDGSLSTMARALEDAGYAVVNYDYPSTSATVEELAAPAIDAALSRCPDDSSVDFVTHSMGGILVRQYLSENSIDKLGRVVMLGPPNKGSEVVDKLGDAPGFELINGPAGRQLGTDPQSVPNSLGPANFEVGIIAGTSTINPILSTLIPAEDDGKVSVENTKLEGMRDHIALPVTHPLMMNDSEVIAQTLYFLRYGEFRRAAQGATR